MNGLNGPDVRPLNCKNSMDFTSYHFGKTYIYPDHVRKKSENVVNGTSWLFSLFNFFFILCMTKFDNNEKKIHTSQACVAESRL